MVEKQKTEIASVNKNNLFFIIIYLLEFFKIIQKEFTYSMKENKIEYAIKIIQNIAKSIIFGKMKKEKKGVHHENKRN